MLLSAILLVSTHDLRAAPNPKPSRNQQTGFTVAIDTASKQAASNAWQITGNAGTSPPGNFIGTTDVNSFLIATAGNPHTQFDLYGQLKTFGAAGGVFLGEGAGNAYLGGGSNNVFIGYQAGYLDSTGGNGYNTALGYQAFNANTSGTDNTAAGYASLYSNNTGVGNSAFGLEALFSNTTGGSNTAVGLEALYTNLGGSYNTAIGFVALYTNTGDDNTAAGYAALYNNTIGIDNTACGLEALYSNTIGNNNTAVGLEALYSNSIGNNNTAVGLDALYSNTADDNTAVGYTALYANSEGTQNTAIGLQALNGNTSGSYNTAVGYQALLSTVTDSHNTAIGYGANVMPGYSNSTALGNGAIAGSSDTIVLGNSNILTLQCNTSTITTPSDGRFKKNVCEAVPGLKFITKLRPVTYNMDMDKMAEILQTPDIVRSKESECLQSQIVKTGFVAQEVEQVLQEIGYDFEGLSRPQNENDAYRLGYTCFIVPLVKAVQEQQAMIETLTKRIDELERAADPSFLNMRL